MLLCKIVPYLFFIALYFFSYERGYPFTHLSQGKVPLSDIRPIEIFMCSVVQRQGYGEGEFSFALALLVFTIVISIGFRWLSQYVSFHFLDLLALFLIAPQQI